MQHLPTSSLTQPLLWLSHQGARYLTPDLPLQRQPPQVAGPRADAAPHLSQHLCPALFITLATVALSLGTLGPS